MSLVALTAAVGIGTIGCDEFGCLGGSDSKGRSHLGFGIYFDWDGVLSRLQPSTKSLIKELEAHRDGVKEMSPDLLKQRTWLLVRWLNSELVGEYDRSKTRNSKSTNRNYDHILASEFIDDPTQKQARGVCRHKAVVMNAILNQVGVNASYLVVGWNDRHITHAVVHIEDYNWIADPTGNRAQTFDTYMKARECDYSFNRNPSSCWGR